MHAQPSVAIAAFLASVAGVAYGGDLDAFDDALSAAAIHQRAAIAYLQDQQLHKAGAELVLLSESWQGIAARFGSRRPSAFEGNSLYDTLLVDVPLRIIAARMMIDLGRPEPARKSLDAIRTSLSAMRRASRVENLADCILDAASELQKIAAAVELGTKSADPAWAATAKARSEAYGATLERCGAAAPQSITRSLAFTTLLQAARDSLARLGSAIDAGDAAASARALNSLQADDRALAQRFG